MKMMTAMVVEPRIIKWQLKDDEMMISIIKRRNDDKDHAAR